MKKFLSILSIFSMVAVLSVSAIGCGDDTKDKAKDKAKDKDKDKDNKARDKDKVNRLAATVIVEEEVRAPMVTVNPAVGETASIQAAMAP